MFHEITITIADSLHDALILKLSSMGCLGMIEQDPEIIVFFPESSAIDSIMADLTIFAALLEKSGEDPRMKISRRLIPQQDWNETWKKGFNPIDVGERFVILPPWEQKKETRINIVIDPAMAFGTGHHETTRSCLVLMEKYERDAGKDSFLDVGCGTGILAIAASKLGWRKVVAVDTDELATEATRENCRVNDAGSVIVQPGSISDLHETFNFIAANLISGVLIDLAPSLASHLKPGSMAVLSGILAGQEHEVLSACGRAKLRTVEHYPDGKWISLVVAR